MIFNMADGILPPCNVARGSGIMTLNSSKRPPYWNSTSSFYFDHITAVDMWCTSLKFYQNRTTPRQKNYIMSIVCNC